jgi:hypothetical protein
MKLQLIVDPDGTIKHVGSSPTAQLLPQEGQSRIEVDGPDDETELVHYQLELLRAFHVESGWNQPKLVRDH